jgi:hypothetical protein
MKHSGGKKILEKLIHKAEGGKPEELITKSSFIFLKNKRERAQTSLITFFFKDRGREHKYMKLGLSKRNNDTTVPRQLCAG